MRKEAIIDIEDGGKSLRFKIRQMPATKQHKFLIKLVLLASRSGVASEFLKKPGDVKEADVKDVSLSDLSFKKLDVAGLISKLGSLDYDSVEPLLNELLCCCSRVVDGSMDVHCTPETIDGYVDDVRTIFRLEMEAAKLNFAFFQTAPTSPAGEAADITITKRTKM